MYVFCSFLGGRLVAERTNRLPVLCALFVTPSATASTCKTVEQAVPGGRMAGFEVLRTAVCVVRVPLKTSVCMGNGWFS